MDRNQRVRLEQPRKWSVLKHALMLLSHRYLFFLILTIIFATVKSDSFSSSGRVAAVVVCLIFQILALAWYVLSYIPFGRDMVKKCFGCWGIACWWVRRTHALRPWTIDIAACWYFRVLFTSACCRNAGDFAMKVCESAMCLCKIEISSFIICWFETFNL